MSGRTFLALLVLTVASVGSAAVAASTSPLPTPPVPPQSAPQFTGCTGANPGLTTSPSPGWSLLAIRTAPLEYFQDPTQPCVVYQASDQQTFSRSSDGGAHFTTVLHDASPAAPGTDSACAAPAVLASPQEGLCPTFQGTSLAFLGRGRLLLSEEGNGDAVLGSADHGTSWHLSDAGLEHMQVKQIVPAPGHPLVAYAVVVADYGASSTGFTEEANLTLLLYRTQDGGATWQQAFLPPLPYAPAATTLQPVFTIDPLDSSRLWVSWPIGSLETQRWDLYESDDGARTWADRSSLPPLQGDPVVSLLALHSSRHPLRLIASAIWAASWGSALAISDDSGATWHTGPIVADDPMLLGVDPADADRDLALSASPGTSLLAYATGDGFDTVQRLPAPAWGKVGSVDWLEQTQPLVGQPLALQGDVGGAFLANLAVFCPGVQPELPACRRGDAGYRAAVIRIDPSKALAATTTTLAVSGMAPPSVPLSQLLTCPLQPSTASSEASGTVAYDGSELLYSQRFEYGPAPYTGVIHAIDPTTCLPRPDIVVKFSKADLLLYDQLNPPAPFLPAGTHSTQVAIGDLAYDSVRNVVWATILTDADGQPGTGLFAIAFDPGAASATAQLAIGNGCYYYLAHDRVDDSLWTCDYGGGYYAPPPAELNTQDGSVRTSCAAGIGRDHDNNGAPATWTFIGPHRLAVEMEDDETIVVWDTLGCHPVASYLHRLISEPLAEDEQITCDPLSFGVDSVAGSLLHGTTVWVRDAEAASVTGYLLPGGDCPVPTTLSYSGPATVLAGQKTELQLDLAQPYPGGANPLSFPVTLTLQGPATLVLHGVTSHGRLSLPWTAAVAPGRYRVTASFDPAVVTPSRATEYLPSSAQDTLDVAGPPALATQPQPGLAAAVPPEPAAPPSIIQPTIAEQLQAQAQTQWQAQTQASTQVQPGVMVQRREQRQVATQAAMTPPQLQEQLAVRRRTAESAAKALDLVVGALVLGLAFFVRVPAAQVARRGPARRSQTLRSGKRPD